MKSKKNLYRFRGGSLFFSFLFFMVLSSPGYSQTLPPNLMTGYGQQIGVIPVPQQGTTFKNSPSPNSSFQDSPFGQFEERQRGLPMTGGGAAEMRGPDYRVHVLGQVFYPGTYRVGPSARVADVIAMAGDVVPNQGSLRHIQLRNSKKSAKQIDLFSYKFEGNLAANPFVQDNDVIFVPFLKKTVRIEGPVKKTGPLEMVEEKNVWDVIQLAGGYTSGTSHNDDVVLIRFSEEGQKQLVKAKNREEELKNVSVQNGDIIIVPHKFTKAKEFDYNVDHLPGDNVFYPSFNDKIYVIGSIAHPGPYPYNVHFNVKQYINMAGPNDESKIKGARVMKPDGKIIRKVNGHILSPGDTIIIPRRHFTVTNTLAWYSTIASSIFTGVALQQLLK